ncbi:TetR/AcrR family transcriptional regulator [Streptomyces sp. M19]
MVGGGPRTAGPTRGRQPGGRALDSHEPSQDRAPRKAAAKPLRAHALRNREALVTAARAAFTAGEADIRVEEIARRAGVGVGTFYRHFESREAVIEAVYDQRVRDLCDSADQLLETLPPHEALHAFLGKLIEYSAASRSMAAALRTVMDLGSPVFAQTRADMTAAIGRLMTAAVATGEIRSDVTPETVFRAMGGVCASRDQPGWEAGPRRWCACCTTASGVPTPPRDDAPGGTGAERVPTAKGRGSHPPQMDQGQLLGMQFRQSQAHRCSTRPVSRVPSG